MHCRASHTVDMACIVQNLPRVLYPSGRKTAHQGAPARCRGASGKTRLQAARPSGKNPRRATTAPQSPLLPQTTPCTGVGGAIQDFTGGQSNQSALDDIVDNYVDTKSFGIDNVVDNTFGTHIAGNVPQIANPGVQTAVMLGGGAGVVARTWGGQTLFQATSLAVRGASLGLNVPYAALATTGGVTFALGYLVKGTYSAGILAGSIIRTGANRVASALCTRQ